MLLRFIAATYLAAPSIAAPAALAGGGAPDFENDIAPLFEARCFSCHAGEKAKSGFRLDARKRALRGGNSGEKAIDPGHPERSRLLALVKGEAGSDGAGGTKPTGLVMPPRGERLTAEQIALLDQWIAAGAPWPDALAGDELAPDHWSFVAPKNPELPSLATSAHADWPRNEVDAFTLVAMERHGFAPSPEADRATLARRVALDLTGLPPEPAELATFLADSARDISDVGGGDGAYERYVRRLLANPHYGERWARLWLDLARYADSSGYGSDPLRPFLWRWRDEVIDAFNRNEPYDQFTLEQLAGDLLPVTTPEGGSERAIEQQLATAFHRNTMTNTEGGTDDEEFRVAAVKDRVDVTMSVWMGLTFGCAKCHSHKFDPIPQKDYYRLFAFFNQTEDADRADEEPRLATPTPIQVKEREQFVQQLAELDAQAPPSLAPRPPAPVAARHVRIELDGPSRILSLAEVELFVGGVDVARSGHATQSSIDFGGPPELAIDGVTDGEFNVAKSTTHTHEGPDPWWEVDLGAMQPIDRIVVWNRADSGLQSRLDGARVSLFAEPDPKLDPSRGERQLVWQTTLEKAPARSVELVLDGPADRAVIAARADFAKRRKELAGQLAALDAAIPRTPVMRELPADRRRETHVLVKSNYLTPTDRVEAATPAAFPPMTAELSRDRLGLARWLVAPENPLTARVAVNRFWAQLFGRGIVETEEDFGTQGTPPTHPELLDSLACRFVASGWDVKELLFTLVTSATYRQSSRVDATTLEKDPRDTWLERFPRRRLEAEMVRDQALAIAGLLDPVLHGPSVFPPQPEGLWQAAFNGERNYPTSSGPDRWRRGLYTFWRRTVPPPSMQTFDAPSRESCTLRRQSTNTPLQAFVTLNAPEFVECAQRFAQRIVAERAEPTARAGVEFALRRALGREPTAEQVAPLVRLYETELLRAPADELAAWTAVANVILNLDALLTKS